MLDVFNNEFRFKNQLKRELRLIFNLQSWTPACCQQTERIIMSKYCIHYNDSQNSSESNRRNDVNPTSPGLCLAIEKNGALLLDDHYRRVVADELDDKSGESVASDGSDDLDEIKKAMKDKDNNEDSDNDDSGGFECDSTEEEEVTLM